MFLFMAPFLAMAKLKQAWLSPSVLTKKFHFMARFLAMAKLKQAWLCPSGLTKKFLFIKSVSEIMTIAYGFFRLHIKKNAPPSTATHLA